MWSKGATGRLIRMKPQEPAEACGFAVSPRMIGSISLLFTVDQWLTQDFIIKGSQDTS